MKMPAKNLRTWIEIDSRAAKKNYGTFRKLTLRSFDITQGKQAQGKSAVKLWAVVKSNAYGHGLMLFSKLMQKFGIDGFCVDSLVEGLRLRASPPAGGGIRKPILVLGPTLPALYAEAAKHNITVTVSSFEALKALAGFVDKKSTKKKRGGKGRGGSGTSYGNRAPEFHLKIDTGMHRQGFYVSEVPKVIHFLSSKSKVLSSQLSGLYTHFASAKDINYPTYTERQFGEFEKATKLFAKAGFSAKGGSASGGKNNFTVHAAATGGALVDPKYHLDAVRIGIGLYGLWPSKELETQLSGKIKLQPVLSWRAVVSEVKRLEKGDYVGYDLVERVMEPVSMAVVPVGYWHGIPRSLSGTGEVLTRGKRARILGRVSMDLITVRLPARRRPGDTVTLIGGDGGEVLLAADVAARAGTIHYELLTRLNPLIERIVV
ncbi:MAG: alanine racemase [Candidatus Liptonbacteria bacterium RIFCSPLOWO2_01_FULL_52_25]|uniref:Alanine racemase n=1 Tax=Candidatus Liptonbacteria bacterium RIFCSPLOWO2_01_FULL_52_25 TaxID=1798650 RepID=A0A1G2CG83_9BACT|nr:MAG: alanine racemase [Candidatus Liptonbacteria bacterium RIFCSPLOWO2_01_FULL_52_25]